MVRRPRRHLVAMLAALALIASLGAPVAQAATSPFTDIAGTTFEQDIDWLFAEGITVGCTPTTYCPDRAVSRGEMASFLVRMFDLVDGYDVDAFTDDDGTTHEQDINRLAFAELTMGCTPTTFCPKAPVRRDEMASFLTRAVPLTDGAGDNYFRDDDGTTHEQDIDRAAAAGITTGCGTWRYCIADSVTRGQMAGFLHRVEKPITAPPHPAPTGPQKLFVATTGVDAGNSCMVSASPCRTIAYALGITLDGDTIVVAAGTYPERDLAPRNDVTITGDPGGGSIIRAPSGGGYFDVVVVAAERTVTLARMTVTGGRGAGVYSYGTLKVADSTITGNRAAGIVSLEDGVLSISNSTISGNRFGIAAGGQLTVSNSTISGNSDRGIVASGIATVANSTISGSEFGIETSAGIEGNGTLNIANSTITENSASGMIIDGGTISISNSTIAGNVGRAIWLQQAKLTITNSTLSGNLEDSPGYPGGILIIVDPDLVDPVLQLKNTLIVGNTSPDTPEIACKDRQLDPVACPPLMKLASIVGIPAGLTLADILVPGGLKDNGGPTKTIALTNVAKNPAKGKGDAATCAAAPVSGLDQRGLPRTPPCDIGAYELQP